MQCLRFRRAQMAAFRAVLTLFIPHKVYYVADSDKRPLPARQTWSRRKCHGGTGRKSSRRPPPTTRPGRRRRRPCRSNPAIRSSAKTSIGTCKARGKAGVAVTRNGAKKKTSTLLRGEWFSAAAAAGGENPLTSMASESSVFLFFPLSGIWLDRHYNFLRAVHGHPPRARWGDHSLDRA